MEQAPEREVAGAAIAGRGNGRPVGGARAVWRLTALLALGVALGASPFACSQAGAATNLVRLQGRVFCDDSGPFLGLGASYFQALRHCRTDRDRLRGDLAFLARNGFNYIRVLGMVSWDGLEIAPVTFTNRAGRVISGWPDYWDQLRSLLDLAGEQRLRVELTIFADAQHVMPDRAQRLAHLDRVLENLRGREDRILHLEVCNEAWQNGFPGPAGVADLRAFARHLADRTPLLVALTSNDDTSNAGIIGLYRDSAADLATVHFSRDTRSVEGGWLPVRDSFRARRLPGVPPVTSNEPIGPGSSVASETDPVKLVSAAAVAYISGLPGYVFHAKAGIYGWEHCCPPDGAELRFENAPGAGSYRPLPGLLPADLPNWTANDGLEPDAPLTVFCDGAPSRYWPGTPGATNGCVRNIGATRGQAFVCLPMGVLDGGVEFAARRSLRLEAFDLLTGTGLTNLVLQAGERFRLPRGAGACLIKGEFR